MNFSAHHVFAPSRIRLVMTMILVLTQLACGEDKSENKILTAKTTQKIDFDGNTTLTCKNGITMYSVFLKSGFVVDQKTATVQGPCEDVVPQMDFSCQSAGEKFVLSASVAGKSGVGGDLGIYEDLNTCEGYRWALKTKR